MKKRGVGVGKWNGPGGKLIPGETAEEVCIRETMEEVGIALKSLERRGTITFHYSAHPEAESECAIFVSTDFEGEAVESEEMRPKWFPLSEIPLKEMWPDDEIWLEGVLNGGTVDATFWFDGEQKIVKYELRGESESP